MTSGTYVMPVLVVILTACGQYYNAGGLHKSEVLFRIGNALLFGSVKGTAGGLCAHGGGPLRFFERVGEEEQVAFVFDARLRTFDFSISMPGDCTGNKQITPLVLAESTPGIRP